MRGARKEKTLRKLDRNQPVPFYLSSEQKALYDSDDYKYLIHLLKTTSDDEYCILQYLLLKFHPLIIKTCSIFAKRISIDWLDLISFTKNAFIELVYQFNLDSSLFFRKYISIALPRAINDYCVYNIRRRNLHAAVRLDDMLIPEQEALLNGQSSISQEREDQMDLQQRKRELFVFIQDTRKLTDPEKKIILEFLEEKDYTALARKHKRSSAQIKKIVTVGIQLIRKHLIDSE